MATLRIATIGTGIIVDWFLEAVSAVDDVEYVGAYSRSLEKAREWGKPRGARLFFDSLDELAACPDIDAVYIASPNALHMPNALPLIKAGKHVLAEKAFASNQREAREAFAKAHEQGVILMEALRTIHTPGFKALRQEVAQAGDICGATLRFSKISSRVPALRSGKLTNTFNPQMAGGGLMDIGVYCVAPMVALWGEPQRIVAMGTTFDVSSIGADPRWPLVELAGEALCDYGSFAVNLSWGKVSDNHLASQIQGTEATILVHGIDQLDSISVMRPAKTEGIYGGYGSVNSVEERLTFPVTAMLADELADFAEACRGNYALAEEFEDYTLAELGVMDEIRRQIGTRFPADEH